MSTRCQTFITEGGEPVATIYRHCDGYPEGMGVDICALIGLNGEYTTADDLVKKILGNTDFKAEIETISAKHGDTEYEYHVDFPEWCEKREPTITIHDLYRNRVIKGTAKDVYNKILDDAWE